MTSADQVADAKRIFLDSAPVIYFVEAHPKYSPPTKSVFDRIDKGDISAFFSPITLAECLVLPYRSRRPDLVQVFTELIAEGSNSSLVPIESTIATRAAELRAQYNFSLTDAIQIAAAMRSSCDLFLTNDFDLKRAREITVVVLGDILMGT